MTEGTDLRPVEPADPPALDPRTVEQLVQNQTRELELRALELDLQQQEERHNFEYARAALTAQTQDRQNERQFQQRQHNSVYWFAFSITLIVAAVIIFAMHFNKDQIAMEIIKSIILLLSGGGVGYVAGRQQSATQSSVSSDS